jgi:hypothetical protein
LKSILLKYIFPIIIFQNFLFSQVSQLWIQRYNGISNSNDYANAMALDNSGNTYIISSSNVNGSGTELLLIKYNSTGLQQWVSEYNTPGNDEGLSVTLDIDGNIIVTGSITLSANQKDIIAIKYNSSGIQQWLQLFNGTGNGDDWASDIKTDNNGNVFICGTSLGTGSFYDIITIKYNSSGVQQWVQRYNGTANNYDEATSLVVDLSEDVYIAGASEGNGSSSDCILIKYNTYGVQQWVQRYNGTSNSDDVFTSLAIDNSNVYAAGFENSPLGYDYVTAKYSLIGTQQWISKYNGTGNYVDIANAIAVDNSGNVYVTGGSYQGNDLFTEDFATVKYNSSGIQQWVTRYNGSADSSDRANSICLDKNNNVYVTGYSFGAETGFDYATIKYNTSGIQQWVQRYNGTGNNSDQPVSVLADTSGNIFVTGSSIGNGSGYDICTIKYSQVVSIKPVSNSIPQQFKLYQNHPNPFNPSTKIRFSVPSGKFDIPSNVKRETSNPDKSGQAVKIIIYDVLGNEISALVYENLKPGSYEVEFNGSNFPSGVYFYKLIAGNFSDTKKLVLIK